MLDESLSSMAQMTIDWVKSPAKKVRPSYNCEGSRGAIKTDDGGTVELNVEFVSLNSLLLAFLSY